MGLITLGSKCSERMPLFPQTVEPISVLSGSIGLNVWIPGQDRQLLPTNHLLHCKQKEQLHVEAEATYLDSFTEWKRATADTDL